MISMPMISQTEAHRLVMKMYALKPCPVCGGKGTLDMTDVTCLFICRCKVCGSTGERGRVFPDDAMDDWNEEKIEICL